jgi:hypothetical protein
MFGFVPVTVLKNALVEAALVTLTANGESLTQK